MDKEFLHGQMEENILANMLMIENKDTEFLFGLMVGNMTDNG